MPASHRPGWQTSEFWISLLTVLLPMVLRATGVEASEIAEISLPVSGASASYVLGRSYAKAKS